MAGASRGISASSDQDQMHAPGAASNQGIATVLQQYWAGQGSYTYVPVQQFSEAFKNSPIGQHNAEALAQPYDKALHKKEALVHTKRSLTGVVFMSP